MDIRAAFLVDPVALTIFNAKELTNLIRFEEGHRGDDDTMVGSSRSHNRSAP
jgi:hypothetical protein